MTSGRDGDVRVGGFTLRGGSSFFINREGFACENVKNYEVGNKNYETMMFYQQIPKIFSVISEKKGGNMLGLEQQKHDSILLTGGAFVPTTNKDFAIAQMLLATLISRLQRRLRNTLPPLVRSSQLIYMNYASPARDSPKGYGKKNVEFIRRGAKKYDPLGAFQDQIISRLKVAKVILWISLGRHCLLCILLRITQ